MTWHFLEDKPCENLHCSQEPVEASWEDYCLDGAPSALLRLMPTAATSCSHDSETVASRASQSGMTSAHLTANRGAGTSMSSAADFHARTSVLRVKAQVSRARALDCGKKWPVSSVKFNPDTCWWKTHRCLFPEDLTSFSLTLPRWGMMRDGELSEQYMPAHPIVATESGSPLPTPSAQSYGTNRGGAAGRKGKVRPGLETMARRGMWPTPQAYSKGASASMPGLTPLDLAVRPEMRKHADRAKARRQGVQLQSSTSGSAQTGGKLNPAWVEWLMGWPIGWTDLKPLATDKFQQWLNSHGIR